MESVGLDAFFIDGIAGRLFCLLHKPPASVATRGAIVYLHPFAEEMNKARRMAALQARAFADAGWLVLQPDLFGCGDSAGEFADARWDIWIDDVARALAWLANYSGRRPLTWGLRAGCLLAVAAAERSSTASELLFWQPVLSGKQHLQQVLRMKIAGALLAEGRTAANGTRQLREQFQKGNAVEVAGYMLSPALALGLDAATLKPPSAGGRLVWLELSGANAPDLSPGSRQALAAWQSAGWRVEARVLPGPPFWQTQEIEEVPSLIAFTTSCVADLEPCAM